MNEAALYNGLLYGYFALCVVVFLVLQFLSAPYGRHTRDGWGPKVPHLAGWMIMEVPAVCTISLCYLQADATVTTPAIVFLGMWQLHYLNRTFVFPFRTRSGGKSMPFVIALIGGITNIGIGYLIGRDLTFFGTIRDTTWLSSPFFITGALLFFIGFFINNQSDTILINLRKPGETGYKIPQGGLYRYVTCPNYFGEMLEWSGFALATSSLGGLAFLLWTVANLMPRAVQNHDWYLSKFEEYPRSRKRLIPFIF